MENHQAESCYFLLKLSQALKYLGVDTDASYKKKTSFHGKNTYQESNNYVRSLINAGFIPYDAADHVKFLDDVDGDHEAFMPDISNIVDNDDYEQEEEEE